jgi:LysR family transcriptional regulator, transcriptional activator of nhaA
MRERTVDELNYHHLYYFWTVAKEGSVTQAARRLFVSQSTVSGQLAQLEEQIGEPLFERRGRNLQLTEAGRIAFSYADEIFPLGNELLRTLKGQHQPELLNLAIGVANVLPKLVVYRFLQPVSRLKEKIRLIFSEDRLDQLLADLALHRLDVVFSDEPASGGTGTRIYNHLLGECDTAFFARPELARKIKAGFPRSLNKAPVLLPSRGTALRRSIEHWFESEKIAPQILGEFDDSALLKIYGQAGVGAFAAPSIISKEIMRQYNVVKLGPVTQVRERFYAISMERKLKHPAVVAIIEAAKEKIF